MMTSRQFTAMHVPTKWTLRVTSVPAPSFAWNNVTLYEFVVLPSGRNHLVRCSHNTAQALTWDNVDACMAVACFQCMQQAPACLWASHSSQLRVVINTICGQRRQLDCRSKHEQRKQQEAQKPCRPCARTSSAPPPLPTQLRVKDLQKMKWIMHVPLPTHLLPPQPLQRLQTSVHRSPAACMQGATAKQLLRPLLLRSQARSCMWKNVSLIKLTLACMGLGLVWLERR
jgi:hypothetical protein